MKIKDKRREECEEEANKIQERGRERDQQEVIKGNQVNKTFKENERKVKQYNRKEPEDIED